MYFILAIGHQIISLKIIVEEFLGLFIIKYAVIFNLLYVQFIFLLLFIHFIEIFCHIFQIISLFLDYLFKFVDWHFFAFQDSSIGIQIDCLVFFAVGFWGLT